MVLAGPVLVATLRWQHVLSQRGGQPLLELSLFRAPSFRSGLIAAFAFMACFASYMFTLALLLQTGLGLDAFHAGLAFAPAGLGFSATALLAPRLVRRFGQAVIVTGAVIAAIGLATLGALAAAAGDHASVRWIVVTAAVISLGNGVIAPTLISAALQDVPPRHSGAAAGALTTGQQFAGAAGVAAVGTLYFATAAAGQGVGMAWAAGADALLVLLVAVLVRSGTHGAATARPARPADDRSGDLLRERPNGNFR
jgi:MFS family permease